MAAAPFKAQNMSLNSYVTKDNCEIARSVVSQAKAAGCEPEADMNPVLLKPTSENLSQVMLLGKPYKNRSSRDFLKKDGDSQELLAIVKESYFRLAGKFDALVLEGAGGAAEINLLQNDVVNLPLADELDTPVVIVADIERGGVFASLYGTYQILPAHLRHRLAGFIINKMHGDPSLLESGIEWLEKNTAMKCFGVLPYIDGIYIDGEDSLSYQRTLAGEADLAKGETGYREKNVSSGYPTKDKGPEEKKHSVASAKKVRQRRDLLDVAVVRLPYLSNYTDFDPLFLEPAVSLRFVASRHKMGTPDLIVLPGSKNTAGDFLWLKERGIDEAIAAANAEGSLVFGICAGYQMLGAEIEDGVESKSGLIETLGMLPVITKFSEEKIIRRTYAVSLFSEPCDIEGYEIHHGTISPQPGLSVNPLFVLNKKFRPAAEAKSYFTDTQTDFASKMFSDKDNLYEGCFNAERTVFGTSLHGVFENNSFRAAFLRHSAGRSNKNVNIGAFNYEALREYEIDKIADTCEKYLDMQAIFRLINHKK